MSTVSDRFADVFSIQEQTERNALVRAELDAYDQDVQRFIDLDTLIRWAEQSLPSAAVACLCFGEHNPHCLRCEVERIVAVRSHDHLTRVKYAIPAPVESATPAPF